VSPAVAPGNPNLGVLLPYTPLHHLLMSSLNVPIVATSANLSDEPLCIDEYEALDRLQGIADLFLVHNRPIVRHVDDSIVRVMLDRELVLRRARGYAPLPFRVRSAECGMRSGAEIRNAECGMRGEGEMRNAECGMRSKPIDSAGDQKGGDTTCNPHSELPASPLPTAHSALRTLLGVGAHLKNAVALAVGPQVFVSQHIGDLETAQAFAAFRRIIADLQTLYEAPAEQVAADAHPHYLSTRFSQETGLPVRTVQHHVAHVLSCMAENELVPPVLGVSWDGTGYGLDGTIWGGEFFRINETGYDRVAHWRQFRLPGGEQAVKEPRRTALGLLFGALGEAAFARSEWGSVAAFSKNELDGLRTMLVRGLNSPWTSSVGRLFDAVAALIGTRQRLGFEGQAAMELEFLAGTGAENASYPVELRASAPAVLDWQPGIGALLRDLQDGVGKASISTRFHNMLVESIILMARRTGLERVVLSGGCFQNRYLTERAVQRLQAEGFRPYWHQRIPPNDGGICLGQVVAARWWKV
jgi:hydrogenase maturation protein HypF